MDYPLSRVRTAPDLRRGYLGWAPSVDETDPRSLEDLLFDLNQPLFIVGTGQEAEVRAAMMPGAEGPDSLPIAGFVPAILPQNLGDPGFMTDHGLKYPYISGAMANGIGSEALAIAMAEAGMLGFFGAAGLSPQRIGQAIDHIKAAIGDLPFGVNLIHAPQEPAWEERAVDLLLAKKVHLVEASAYLALTPAVVRYRTHGIHEDALGRIITPNRIIAKVSRIEVATRFLSPPPEKILRQLVAEGHLTPDQAHLASKIPMAQDITAEADSGGHTDNRPAIALLPTIMALRDRLARQFGYTLPLRVGLAGGISTPASAAAAFSMGAGFILLGSVHQACVESGTSDTVRTMLAEAEQADIAMAPAADMFEMGVNLQVLKRGTMFPMRASKLYQLYRSWPSLEAIPPEERANLERSIFKASFQEIWNATRSFFSERDPAQISRAESDPKHKMALVFRWYLGKSSGWANAGDPSRKMDYQIWCGPAMGAFNEWVKGTFLEPPQGRRVETVAKNILYGAAVFQRINSLRQQGFVLDLPPIAPRPVEDLKEFFH